MKAEFSSCIFRLESCNLHCKSVLNGIGKSRLGGNGKQCTADRNRERCERKRTVESAVIGESNLKRCPVITRHAQPVFHDVTGKMIRYLSCACFRSKKSTGLIGCSVDFCRCMKSVLSGDEIKLGYLQGRLVTVYRHKQKLVIFFCICNKRVR